MSSHTDTASRTPTPSPSPMARCSRVVTHRRGISQTIKIRRSNSVMLCSGARHRDSAVVSSHADGVTLHIELTEHDTAVSVTVSWCRHTHTKSHSTSSSCGSHTAPLVTAAASWCCHTQTPPHGHRLRRHRQWHAVIVSSHTDGVSLTSNRHTATRLMLSYHAARDGD
jgi:hypothetical protein